MHGTKTKIALVLFGISTFLSSPVSACGVGGFCGAGGSGFSLNIAVGAPAMVPATPPPAPAFPLMAGPVPPTMAPGFDPTLPPFPGQPFPMGGHGYYGGFGGGFVGGPMGGGFAGGVIAGGGAFRGQAMGGCGHRRHGGGCRQRRCGHRRMKCCGSLRRGAAWGVRVGVGLRGGRGGFVKVRVKQRPGRLNVRVKARV